MTYKNGFILPSNRQRVFSALFSIFICLSFFAPIQAQTDTSISAKEKIKVSGVKFKDSIKLGDASLQLNGVGLRTKFFLDLYISALYLQETSHDAAAIINADEVMLIQIHVISNLITSENLSKGTAEGFSKSTNNHTKPIQKQIDEFLDAFNEPVTIGDIFEFVYQPDIGITIIKNRKVWRWWSKSFW